jgi:[acyl-carrier-protein] S-malonyltransferase
MAAILGLDIPTLDKICAQASTPEGTVQVANDNCPGQVVISGAKAAVEQALVLAKAAGARRAIPLAVSIAAHSPLMASIQSDWDAAVDSAVFRPLDIPVIGNVIAADLRTPEMAREDVKSQMQSRVRWTESILLLVERGITTFVEVGSGSVLGGLVKRIAPGVDTLTLGTPQDFSKLQNMA